MIGQKWRPQNHYSKSQNCVAIVNLQPLNITNTKYNDIIIMIKISMGSTSTSSRKRRHKYPYLRASVFKYYNSTSTNNNTKYYFLVTSVSKCTYCW